VKQIKPNFKALGPRFGKDMGLISKEIQFSQRANQSIDKEGSLEIVLQEIP
jgi:isoleucyl-tRNA synthetase